MNTAEKIETVVNCYLKHGTTEGTCGSISLLPHGGYLVLADDRFFYVKRRPVGWEVYSAPFISAIDESLYGAASLALVEGKAS